MSEEIKTLIEQAMETSGRGVPDHFKPEMIEAFLKIYRDDATPKEALKISNEIMESVYNYAYNLFKAGKYSQAVKFFEVLRRLNLADVRYSFATAACYQYMGNYTNAAANYVICKEIDELNPIPCFHLYDCYMKLHKPVAAAEALAEVIGKSNQNPQYSQLKERALLEIETLKENLKTYIEENHEQLQEKIQRMLG